MPQDINTMRFCTNCRMNVYPTRPEFNTVIFAIFAGIMFVIITIFTIMSIVSFFFDLIFFLYLFMLINPYLIYYGIMQRNYCPKCRSMCSEKPNREYEPFGLKKGEGLPTLPYEQASLQDNAEKITEGWFCPYCGSSISRNWRHCKACGKMLEINL